VFALFVKLAFRLPLSAFAAPLLFHAINDPMTLLIHIVFSHIPPVSPVTLVAILTLALFAPIAQSIFISAVFAKLTLSLPFFASGASLHFGYLPQFLMANRRSIQRAKLAHKDCLHSWPYVRSADI